MRAAFGTKVVSGLAALAVAVSVEVGCGGGSTDASTQQASGTQAHQRQKAASRLPRFRYLQLSGCPGSFHLKVHGTTCDRAKRAAGVLANLVFNNPPRTPGEYRVYRSRNYPQAAGWRCWGQLVHRYGPIQYVCWQRGQVLLFSYGG
jgi:hypothetical protein